MMTLRVQLMDIEPAIWRDLVVPAPIKLDLLHHVIQAAMAWHDTHLHEFMIDGVRYELPSEDGFDDELQGCDESEFRLADLVSTGDRFVYVYDFGDNWRHEIQVLSHDPMEGSPDTVWPTCTDGARACPPEDCGGVSGYERLIEILKNEAHSEHEELRQRAGHFHPELFSVQQAAAFVQAMYYTHESHKLEVFRLKR